MALAYNQVNMKTKREHGLWLIFENIFLLITRIMYSIEFAFTGTQSSC